MPSCLITLLVQLGCLAACGVTVYAFAQSHYPLAGIAASVALILYVDYRARIARTKPAKARNSPHRSFILTMPGSRSRKPRSPAGKSERQEAWEDFLEETLEHDVPEELASGAFNCYACQQDLPADKARAFAYTYERSTDCGWVSHDYCYDGLLCGECASRMRKMKGLHTDTKYFFLPKPKKTGKSAAQ